MKLKELPNYSCIILAEMEYGWQEFFYYPEDKYLNENILYYVLLKKCDQIKVGEKFFIARLSDKGQWFMDTHEDYGDPTVFVMATETPKQHTEKVYFKSREDCLSFIEEHNYKMKQ